MSTGNQYTTFLKSLWSYGGRAGVREIVESFSVRMGREIMARRIELHLTQRQLAQLVKKNTGEPMTQSMISKIEGGTPGITAETYNRVLRTLGMTDLKIVFGQDPDDKGSEIHIKSTSFAKLFQNSTKPLRPYDLRHTFAVHLATKQDAMFEMS